MFAKQLLRDCPQNPRAQHPKGQALQQTRPTNQDEAVEGSEGGDEVEAEEGSAFNFGEEE